MNNAELRELQARLGFTNPQLAAWLGYSLSSVVKLRRDGVPVPGPVARALRQAVALDRVAKLNPDAGEIGPGMLATIVTEARAQLEVPTEGAPC